MTTITQYYYQSIDSWAEQNLSPSELTQFRSAQQANNTLWASYRDTGAYSTEILYERIFINELNTEVDVAIGEQVTFATGVNPDECQLDPDWRIWMNRYAQGIS